MHEPHDPESCPACASRRIVHGSVPIGEGLFAHFYPTGLRFLTMNRSVMLMCGSRFFGCLDCDLVWSNMPPGHLQQLISQFGKQELKERLAIE